MSETETSSKQFEQAFDNFRKTAESNLEWQQTLLKQWGNMWPGVPGPQAAWLDQVKDFRKRWAETVSDLSRKHRETVDRQYQSALESLEEGLRIGQSEDPEQFRKRAEHFCRKSLDCLRETSEVQIREFQEALNKWTELVTKSAA